MLAPLILASTSPRRRELLSQLGIPFEVVPSPYVEANDPTSSAQALVIEQSLGKAQAVAELCPGRLVLGADTLVVGPQGEILGKPRDAAEAEAMLALLQGSWHEVYSGVALVSGAQTTSYHQVTRVRLLPLTPADIAWYVATQEPLDKAGAYAIQGIGAALVAELSGCYTTVVGLPLPWLFGELKQRGYLT